MTFHLHHMTGCQPTPLAHYLKALGILRLVAQQADTSARGCWRSDGFVLATALDRESLLDFFLAQYAPTPLVTPWNGGSGFYPKDTKKGIEAIAASQAQRFGEYRAAIALCQEMLGDNVEKPNAEAKVSLLQECERTWRGPLAEWLRAAVTLLGDGSAAYPALLGTGGNDGRLEFANNFMQRLADLFQLDMADGAPRPEAVSLLDTALFESPHQGLQSNAVGQFLPGAVGGANGSTGFTADAELNPWDFVLMLEGSIVFAASLSRRGSVDSLPQAAAPFAVRSAAAGFSTAADGENARGEQWMPIWRQLAEFSEVQNLLSEARCQLKSFRAQRPLDMARAIARLGVARGVTSFERYAYIERNGLSNLAVPLGRWNVSPQPNQHLLEEIAPWFDRLERAAADKNAPEAIRRATRRVHDAMLNCCREGATPVRWLELMVRLGEAESQFVRSSRFSVSRRLQPIGNPGTPLSPDWLIAGQELADRPEFRLALALASQHGTRLHQPDAASPPKCTLDWGRPVRQHFLPLAKRKSGGVGFPHGFAVAGDELASDNDVVCHRLDAASDALALMRRRIWAARAKEASSRFDLRPVFGAEASLVDIADLIDGRIDWRLIGQLLPALMALNWRAFAGMNSEQRRELHRQLGRPEYRESQQTAERLSAYGIFRLNYHWNALPVPQLEDAEIRVRVTLDATPFNLLLAGDLHGSGQAAIRRLRNSQLWPHLDRVAGSPTVARRMAESLAFPISDVDTANLVDTLTRPTIRADEIPPDPMTLYTT